MCLIALKARLAPLAVATLVVVGGCGDTDTATDPRAEAEPEVARLIADEASEAELPYLEDGLVTAAEREAAFLAYVDCLEASGIEVLDYHLQPRGGDSVQSRPGSLDVETADQMDRACREQHYAVISLVFRLQSLPTAQEEAEIVYSAGECLRDRGLEIPDGGTRDDLKRIAPVDSFDCLDEAEGIERPTFTQP